MSKNFTWPVSAYLYDDYVKLKDCIEQNKEKFVNKELIIFGAGIRGCVFGKLLSSCGYSSFVYVDNNKDKWGGYIFDENHPIKSPEYLLDDKENKAILVSIESIELVQDQLRQLGYVENENLFYIVTDIYGDFVKEFSRGYNNDTLIIGDCFFNHVAISDENKDSLGKMLKDIYGEENLKILTMHGMGIKSFYHLVEEQFKMGYKPKNLMVMTNFEAFSKRNHLLPRTQHANLFKLLKEQICNKSENFAEHVDLLTERANVLVTDEFKSNKNGTLIANTKILVKMNYMKEFSYKSESCEYLIKIMELCKKEDVKCTAFIPPLNFEYKRSLFEEFDNKYKINLDKMNSMINDHGYEVLDFSYTLEQSMFAEMDAVHEISKYEGRKKLIDIFINAMKEV